MTEQSHTSGPWSACKGGDCQCGLIWDATGNCLVAVAQGETEHLGRESGEPDCVPTDDGQRANARLIAAAPDMLTALERITAAYAQHNGETPLVLEARKAISKATGKRDAVTTGQQE